MYLVTRHFTDRQVREMMWQKVAGTFAARGGRVRKALKVVVSLVYLPDTIRQLRKNIQRARAMREHFPQIPSL